MAVTSNLSMSSAFADGPGGQQAKEDLLLLYDTIYVCMYVYGKILSDRINLLMKVTYFATL